MQGARAILVAVTYTYISEESLSQNAHAENSKYFINQGTLSFLHISTKPPHFNQEENKTTQRDNTVSHTGIDEDFFRDRMKQTLLTN
jgi:hypothetical protein